MSHLDEHLICYKFFLEMRNISSKYILKFIYIVSILLSSKFSTNAAIKLKFSKLNRIKIRNIIINESGFFYFSINRAVTEP